jgi:hypothetical protein
MPLWAFLIYSLAIFVAIVFWARIPGPKGNWFALLGLLLILALIDESVSRMIRMASKNQSWVINIYTFVELLVILQLSYWSTSKGRLISVLGGISIFTFLFFAAKNGITESTLFEPVMVNSITLTILSFVTLWNLAETSSVTLIKVPEFWFYLSILVFYGGLIPIMGTTRMIYEQNPKLSSNLYLIVPILITVRYAMTAYCCYLERNRRIVVD